ncbi:MAG: TonB-dependent receptor [Rhodobacteraceae bacterium]|nr:TonB-dependent receptor [Paracoccaceae bacterium]
MNSRFLTRAGLLATVFGIAQSNTTLIDTAQAQVRLEEIVVTARKREESLLDVPLSITALTGKDIESLGVLDSIQLSDFVPGFYMQNNNAGRNDRGNRTLIFRGLARGSGVNAGGTMFVDGAPLLSGEIQGLTDVERVEILRGPQSVYFGRATFSGAVNYITKTPGNEWSGKAKVDLSRFNTSDVELSVEGPVVEDKLSFRVSTRQYNKGGDYINFGRGDERLGDQSTESYGLNIYASPNDQLDIRANFNYFFHDDGSPADVKIKVLDGYHNCNPFSAARAMICGSLPDVSELKPGMISANTEITPEFQAGIIDRVGVNGSLYPNMLKKGQGLARRGKQATLNIDYELSNGMTFGAISAWHKDDRQVITDLASRDTRDRPNPLFGTNPNVPYPRYIDWRYLVESYIEDWSQEVRFSSADNDRLRWTVGGTYVGAKTEPSVVIGHNPTSPAQTATNDFSHVDTYGVFGGLYYDISEQLTVAAEARYQSDKLNVVDAARGTDLKTTFKSFSPRVTLDYKPTEDSTVYFQYAKGTRPGGFNANVLNYSATELERINQQARTQLAYDEEVLEQFELGVKGRFFDDRARASLSVYYGNLKNEQIAQAITFIDDGGEIRLQSFTVNLGKTRIQGVEFEGAFQATDNFQLSGQFAINDTNIRKFYCAACLSNYTGSADVTGNRRSGVPRTSGSVSGEFTNIVTGNTEGYVRMDVIYRGPQYVTEANLTTVGEAVISNVRAGIRTDAYSLEAYVTNLFDDDTLPSSGIGVDVITFQQNEYRANLPDRRHWGIRATYNF